MSGNTFTRSTGAGHGQGNGQSDLTAQHGRPLADGLRVGYVLKRFPRLSETFILNEMLALERLGARVEVFSLQRPPQEPTHELLDALRAPVLYLPGRESLDGLMVRERGGDQELRKRPLAEMLQGAEPNGGLLDTLFAGKSEQDRLHLCQQAMALALLATTRGISHLHAHFASNATSVAMLASRLSDIGFSFTAHARDIYHCYVDARTDRAVRKLKLDAADFVVTVNDYNAAHLSTIAGADARIHRIYNGIDLQRLTMRAEPPDSEPQRIMGIGRLVPKKGFDTLLEACAGLRDQGFRFVCEIVGDGPEREALQARIEALRLAEQVRLHGALPQERTLALLARADVLALPARITDSGDRDALPTVLLEALALGVPVVSTDVCGIPEIVDHERCGLLVSQDDPRALAAALQRILTTPELAGELARAGRARACSEFDLQRNAADLLGRVADSVRARRGGQQPGQTFGQRPAIREASDAYRIRAR
ncbi:MAG: glycosyltransferase family 4 protein [Gammaproteobacteria bacterium]|nr:glycosyltransferase family 4 protein [Gammaproteobacteria bacterium]